MPVLVGNLCFIHTAKAAGSAIGSIFGLHGGKSIFKNKVYNVEMHNPPRSFNRFCITNVRNPLEMWVSSWSWGCSNHPESGGLRSQFKTNIYTTAEDIEGFRRWCRITKENLIEVNSHSFAPSFCESNVGALQSQRVMQSCAGDLSRINYFLKAENIKDDFKEAVILSKEPLKDNWEEIVDRNFAKRYKKTPHLPYEKYYTKELRDEILKKEILFKRWYPELYEGIE